MDRKREREREKGANQEFRNYDKTLVDRSTRAELYNRFIEESYSTNVVLSFLKIIPYIYRTVVLPSLQKCNKSLKRKTKKQKQKKKMH